MPSVSEDATRGTAAVGAAFTSLPIAALGGLAGVSPLVSIRAPSVLQGEGAGQVHRWAAAAERAPARQPRRRMAAQLP